MTKPNLLCAETDFSNWVFDDSIKFGPVPNIDEARKDFSSILKDIFASMYEDAARSGAKVVQEQIEKDFSVGVQGKSIFIDLYGETHAKVDILELFLEAAAADERAPGHLSKMLREIAEQIDQTAPTVS